MTNQKTTDHLQIYIELFVRVVCVHVLVCAFLLSFLSSLIVSGYFNP